MKYYIIAGEASGDLHASNLIKEIFTKDPDAQIKAWGGDLMSQAGAEIRKHIRDLAFMGFSEVVMNIGTILRNISYCKEDILNWKPDALILIDYPGFNLRIAKWAKKQGFKVIYYISPQIWAWHESRVHNIKKCVDLMLVILPFEKEFYHKYNFEVSFVGHPLLDVIPEKQDSQEELSFKPIIALLPGSRKQEISRMLPVMLAMVNKFPAFHFALACAPAIADDFYEPFLLNYPQVEKFHGKTYTLLNKAYFGLVTSGTATLETALFGVPQIVCYKGQKLSYLLARRLIKIPYISLVNLIMGKEVVKELIQDEMNEKSLANELSKLTHSDNRIRMQSDYHELRIKLGMKGASVRAAQAILDFLKS